MTIFTLNMAYDTSQPKLIRWDYHLSFMAIFVWGKFIFMFENTRTFGPLIKIIIVMTLNLMKFLVIWALVILLFGCVATIVFIPYNAFQTIGSTFYFLICAALGNWDNQTFNIENMSPSA
jgi:hypothetical protein